MRRRLLLAQSLVLVTGGVTTWVVASVVGPPLFREHLHIAGVAPASNEQYHAEQAYQHATALSIGVAITVAALTALIATVYLSRRLQQSVAEVAAAASAVAEGHYAIHDEPPHLGDEFDEMASAFNKMADRLQAVESSRRQLFGDLAHEIRTPVSVLEAYLEAVEDGVKALDRPTVAMLREQAGRLVRFSAHLAALAQAEEAPATITPAWVNADDVIESVTAAVADRYAAKNVALTVREGQGISLWADGQRLTQVLHNLLDNALRHTSAGGHVQLGAERAGSAVVFTVSDDGEGIAAQHLRHVFERFYRADSAPDRGQGGSGIGLAIAKALTEAHGGTITVTSNGRGTGTTFTVSVPSRPTTAGRRGARREFA